MPEVIDDKTHEQRPGKRAGGDADTVITDMSMARRRAVMQGFVIGGWLYGLGWLSTAAMTLSVVAMAIGFFI